MITGEERESYVLSVMWDKPKWLDAMIEDEGVPQEALNLLCDLLDSGLPMRNHTRADDCHVDRLERGIELLRLAFAQWATREPRWGGESPVMRVSKMLDGDDE